ncbi:MAG: flippase-like domain-containing protein [Deltaproteobacteria bacterium]|nr:flippase-like domain-containing protein [Deltaproteobacteria bacterium]
MTSITLFFALRGVDWESFIMKLSQIDVTWLISGMLIGQISNIFRTVRWSFLFEEEFRPSIVRLYQTMMIGYLANNILPARLGEAVRLESLRRTVGISRGQILTSLIVEKIMDGITLVMFIWIVMSFYRFPPWVSRLGWVCFSLFVGILAGCFIVMAMGATILRWIHSSTRLFGSIGDRIFSFSSNAISGLEVLRNIGGLFRILLLSAAVWVVEVLAVYMIMRSMGLKEIHWVAPVLLISTLSLGMLLPSSPGYVGVYEFLCIQALAVFSVDKGHALGIALVMHTQFILLTVAIGIICLQTMNFKLLKMVKSGAQ